MAPFISAPDPTTLLPPLLACLPTAFCSTRPPPALPPLLSPILRQRVTYLSSTTQTSEASWLPLLCWDATEAQDLAGVVENTAFELHPVSGEIELGDVGKALYRRKDAETIQALLRVPDLAIAVVYVWCEMDEGGDRGEGQGWRVAELRLLNRVSASSTGKEEARDEWLDTIAAANARFDESRNKPQSDGARADAQAKDGLSLGALEDDDDDDDYWARYDATPGGRTPALKPSPAPRAGASLGMTATARARSPSEDAYYAQYSSVQPEMDSHDPELAAQVSGDSTLPGDALSGSSRSAEAERERTVANGYSTTSAVNGYFSSIAQRPTSSSYEAPTDQHRNAGTEVNNALVHTRPATSTSSSSSSSSAAAAASIAHLEQAALAQSAAALAVQQHVTTSLQSLWRLARATGIDTADFRALVAVQLDVLEGE